MNLAFTLALAAIVWFGLRGSFGASAALVLGALAMALVLRSPAWALRPPKRWVRKAVAVVHVLALFCWELLLSNMQQLQVVFGPSRRVQPHWLSFRTELESPALRALLGMLISLTPGTMTVDVEEDGTVWVHVLVAEDDEAVVRRLRTVLERPLRRLES